MWKYNQTKNKYDEYDCQSARMQVDIINHQRLRVY